MEIMLLYHGSSVIVEHPEIRVSGSLLDFGAGFYTTTSAEQARRWAKIKSRRENTPTGYISVYEFDVESAELHNVIKRFDSADRDWLMFVVSNRQGVNKACDVDLHAGPVADDNVYQTVRLFETGVLDPDETVKRLKTEVLHDQWAFHTDRILSHLRFIRCEEVTRDDV